MKARVFKVIILLVIVFASVSYGMVAYKFQLPPHTLVQFAYRRFGMFEFMVYDTPRDFKETPEIYFKTDVAELISIERKEDISRLRNELIELLWGEPGLPGTLPSIETGITDSRYDDISSLSRIDKLSVVMDYGLDSNIYHFIPRDFNNQVVLYHEGHYGDFFRSKAQIEQFLDNGFSVVAFCMPLWGLNNQPTVYIPRIGYLKLTWCDAIKFLSPESGHPVKYFIEPVIIALNYIMRDYDYSSVSMVGISGGGWTTTLAAAVDTRIQKSFPVAGSYPIFLRSESRRDWGDWEQTVPEIYTTANYLELYILGAAGLGRKQVQVINQYDICCFAGTKSETYKDIVRELVSRLEPGEFDLFLDVEQRRHEVSNNAMEMIIAEIKRDN